MAKQNLEFNGTAQGRKENYLKPEYEKTIPTSEEARKLAGSYAGYQPKPSVEIILVAMKPLTEKTYVDQALKNGKGITWFDDGRIPYQSDDDFESRKRGMLKSPPHGRNGIYGVDKNDGIINTDQYLNKSGRFPANLLVSDNILDNGIKTSRTHYSNHNTDGYGGYRQHGMIDENKTDYSLDDGNDFSRYFSLDAWYSKNIEELPDYAQRIFPFLYAPKASNSERSEGLNTFEERTVNDGRKKDTDNPFQRGKTPRKNIHPTVKPLKLMSYLVTIGSRPGDTILDPFMGSGTTGVAAKILHRNFIGFEIEGKYFEIAQQRIENKVAKGSITEFEEEE